ncbi:MAG: S53 family peptidase [Oligoflexia bacterium]|nr:S53 family peptidase [Oligoflexia bacterium]
MKSKLILLSVYGLTIVSCGGAVTSSSAAGAAGIAGTKLCERRLASHVPAAVARATDRGKLDDTKALNLTIALNPKDEAQLAQDVSAIYTPGSSTYRQYLTPQEFRARYAPSADQVEQVKSFLQAQGLQKVSVDEGGFLIHAEAAPSVANAAFGTEIHNYQRAGGESFYAPSQEVRIPPGLPIQGVHGLQNLSVRRPHLVRRSNAKAATAHAGTGSGFGGGFAPADLRGAYNVPQSGGGAGQTLAVFELDGYDASDVQAYEKAFGIPNIPLQNVFVDGSTGAASGASAEVTLDIELIAALAPNATKILVYEGPNGDQGILDTYARIANDNLATSISTSWGSSEGGNTSAFMQSENTIFMQMAAQGQTLFAAAGDAGAYDDGSSLGIDDPGSQPYAVAVGGTKLSTNGSQAWQSETTWNSGSASSGAGGGGVSTTWPIPSWQKASITAAAHGSTTMRNTPDVSLHSDESTGYAIYWQGSWSDWGGTSCAAPLWAGFTALVNEQRISRGLPTVGYLNPMLYALAQGGSYGNDFHDVKDGSTNLYYPAVAGYDNATGLGSFNGTSLLNDLVSEPSVPVKAAATATASAECSSN